MIDRSKIRNFSIIAHIDHGKSTLADRFLEITKTVDPRAMQDQMLDQMDLEREKGITIKMQPVNMTYVFKGQEYFLNLIDTPGHSDFGYEVSRALAAVEGALLLVDATQGVEAQTISNLEIALSHDLTIIPVVNKIDLPNADVAKVSKEITDVLGIPSDEIISISAKTGAGVEELIHAIVQRIPAPKKTAEKGSRALVFDSWYDPYRGVRASVRIVSGTFHGGDQVAVMRNNKSAKIVHLGFYKPKPEPRETLDSGMTGYIETGFKSIRDCRVGDTLTLISDKAVTPLSGYEEPQPKVFAGMFLTGGEEVHVLTQALEKLQLNDAALTFHPIRSDALGFGHRLGLLGLLHLEIVQERLEREFNLSVIVVSPSVPYQIRRVGNEKVEAIHSPSELPEPHEIESILEPWAHVEIVTLSQYLGRIMDLAKSHRAVFQTSNYFGKQSVSLIFEMPLADIIADFYDKLKKISSGYASFSYSLLNYRVGDLVKLDILVNGETIDALSSIVPRQGADARGRTMIEALKEKIPKKQFQIALQAAIYGKIIARTNIAALRKDVTAKLYGGDVTRKRKLLEKQKSGKKRLKQIGGIEIPQEAFLAVLRSNSEQ